MNDNKIYLLEAEQHLLIAVLKIIDALRVDEGCMIEYEGTLSEQELSYECLSGFLALPISVPGDSDYSRKKYEAYVSARKLLPKEFMTAVNIEMESLSIKELRAFAFEIRDKINSMCSEDI